MPKPKETYRILVSGHAWCGKTSVRARIAGQALPNHIQLTFPHNFPLVECLVPKGDPEVDQEAWKEWQTGAVEAPTEGEVGGKWKAGKGKRRAKFETQESSLGRCYDGLEALNFIGMDVVAICFSVGMADTFDERLQALLDQKKGYGPKTPLVLVGLQTDLRNEPGQSNIISTEEAKARAKSLGVRYVECSALTGEGVEDVFKLLTWTALYSGQESILRLGRCIIC